MKHLPLWVICSALFFSAIECKDPMISIIAYLHGQSQNIDQFIEHVAEQTIFTICELIIIDTRENNSCESIVTKYAQQYPNIRYRNLYWDPGLYAGINMGSWLVQAPYTTVFLIEDRYEHDLLECELAILQSNPLCDLVYCLPETESFAFQGLWKTHFCERCGYFMKGFEQLYLHAFIKQVTNRKGQTVRFSYPGVHHVNNESKCSKELALLDAWHQEIKSSQPIKEKPMVIVIPSYNNASWHIPNLNSVFSQKYENYRVIYCDDVSTDNTGNLVEEYIQQHNQNHRSIVIRNKQRIGALANLYNMITSCYPEEIIIMLDGDDWFAHEYVLDSINRIYDDPNVWITYGQFMMWPSGNPGWTQPIPIEWIDEQRMRNERWSASHLRTCYAGLFHYIKVEDLQFEGRFWQMAWDLAIMFPMIEMAGSKHSKFIPEILYMYNRGTGMHDDMVNAREQTRLCTLIRERPAYQPITHLQVH